MKDLTKGGLLKAGMKRVEDFCELNDIKAPEVKTECWMSWPFDVCAYYRDNTTFILLVKCAPIGRAGAAWSWPGYVIDRTPYGVLAHELGHHVDVMKGEHKKAYSSEFSRHVRRQSKEPRLTNYCPNSAEWFAEMFRLFVTNPDLLRSLRPKTYTHLLREGFEPLNSTPWKKVLEDAPSRTIAQAQKKITMGRKRYDVIP